MTTVAIGRDGRVYDIGGGEFPGDKYVVENGRIKKKPARTIVKNAFTCTKEEAKKLKR